MKQVLYKLGLCFLLLAALLTGCALLDRTAPSIESKAPTVEYDTILTISDVADVTDNQSGVEVVFQQTGNGNISDDGTSIAFDSPGEYTVSILATDAHGNNSELDCSVTVIDATSPKIVSVGSGQEIGYGQALTVTENANIPNSICVEYEDVSDVLLSIYSVQKAGNGTAEGCYTQNGEASVTLTQIGDYILTIEATDSFGNSNIAKANISAIDLTPPVISGLSRITISERDALPNFLNGITATDEIDGDLSQQVAVDASAVKKGIPGTYKVQYSVTDASGNSSNAERVVLIQDTTPPTIKLSKTSLSFTVGGNKPDYESLVSASDAVDGDVTKIVSVDDSSVNYSKAGTYTVKYSVKDSSGNSSTKSLKVVVKEKAASTTASNDRTVYITRTGSKYHLSGCRYLSRSKIAISRSNARASGYTACKVCWPG